MSVFLAGFECDELGLLHLLLHVVDETRVAAALFLNVDGEEEEQTSILAVLTAFPSLHVTTKFNFYAFR